MSMREVELTRRSGAGAGIRLSYGRDTPHTNNQSQFRMMRGRLNHTEKAIDWTRQGRQRKWTPQLRITASAHGLTTAQAMPGGTIDNPD